MKTDSVLNVALEAIRAVTGSGSAPVALHEPCFVGNEWEMVKRCLDSGWVSSAGEFVGEFERRLCQHTGARHAVAVVNGTAALHTALLLAGVMPGDEVLVPTLTFIGTANAVAYCGATPHFVDSEEETLGVDPDKLSAYLAAAVEVRGRQSYNRATGRRIAALVPMHTFGHPVRLRELLDLGVRYGFPVVEDAAESLGSYYEGRHTGTFGKLGILSFNGNKIITTGGGGAVLTDDPDLAQAARHLTTTARVPHAWSFIHDRVAFNYRMPNINAALGCAQLEYLDDFLSRKRHVAQAYLASFSGVNGMRIQVEPKGCVSNYWLNTLVLDRGLEAMRDALLAALGEAGIMARPAWTLMHRLPMYTSMPRMDLSTAESLEARIISLPSSATLGAKVADS